MIIFKKRKRHLVSIEMAPLIDLVFTLLIFIMLTSTYAHLRPAFQMRLPVLASSGQSSSAKLVIAVDAQQNIYLNDQPVDLAELNEKLKPLQPLKDINFRADRATTYGLIIKIMEKLKKAGIQNIALEYSRKK